MGKNAAVTCTNCGVEVNSGLLFCPACGSLVVLSDGFKTSDGKLENNDADPNNLGFNAVHDDEKSTGGLGIALDVSGDARLEPDKLSMRFIAMVVIAALVVLGIVCAAIMLGGNKDEAGDMSAMQASDAASTSSSDEEGRSAVIDGRSLVDRNQNEADDSVFVEYESKLNEIISRYGEPDIEKGEQWRYATGLVFARLLDFGGESEYLALAYYDPSNDADAKYPAGYPESYQFEIWAPANDKGIERVFSGFGSLSGQNIYCVSISYISKDGKAYVLDGESQYGPGGYSYSRLWGVNESGDFGVVKTARANWGTNGSSFEIDGANAGESEYNDLVGEWRDNTVAFYPTALDSSTDRDVSQIIATVGETFDELGTYTH